MPNRLLLATAALALFASPVLAQSTPSGNNSAPIAKQTAPSPASGTDANGNMPVMNDSGMKATSPMKDMSATNGASTSGGITKAKSANFAVRFIAPKPADLMTSKLIGTAVYNNQNDKLGTIEDLMIDNGKTLSGVVVSVGGFLGIGDSYVLIDPSTLVVDNDNGTWKAFVDTSKDTLKNAPKFTYSHAKS